MMTGINYFSMHREIQDAQRQTESALKQTGLSSERITDALAKAAEVKEGAEAFEGYFIQTLLKEMRKTVPKQGDEGLGLGRDMYESMFDEAIASQIAKSGGLGLAKMLSEKLSQDLKSSARVAEEGNDPQVFEAIDR